MQVAAAAAAAAVEETKWSVQVYTAHKVEPGLSDIVGHALSVHSSHTESPRIANKGI